MIMKVYIKREVSRVSGQENDYTAVYSSLKGAQKSLCGDLDLDFQYFPLDGCEADIDLEKYDIHSLANETGDVDFPAKSVYLWRGDRKSPDEFIRYDIEEHEVFDN